MELVTPPATEIRTPRLRLRPYGAGDFERVFREIVLDPVVVRYWPEYDDPALTEADRRAMAEHDLGSWIEEGIAAGYPTWVIEAADPGLGPAGDFVGIVGVMPAQYGWGPEPEVGCLLASRHHGRGVATEALGAAMADATARLGIDAFAAIVDEPNRASIRLVEKTGFVLERTFAGDDGAPCRRYVRRADGAAPR